MASLEQRGNWFRVIFRHNGERHTHRLDTTDFKQAEILKGGIEHTLMLIEQNLLTVPDGADLYPFLVSRGQVVKAPEPVPEPEEENPLITLKQLKEKYLETHSLGAMEANSLATVTMHLDHFLRTFGPDFTANDITLARLQDHVNRRAKARNRRGGSLSPVTLQKEMGSFRAVWNWGVRMGLVVGGFPHHGIVYPKTDEKPAFQTWQQITRQIAAGGVTEDRQQELWDCLFLTLAEIQKLLNFVREQARQSFLYPMVCFAAYTGARRGEIIRARLTDVDFDGKTILIREKKKAKGKRTTRRVPLTPLLARVLLEWLTIHPGGPFLFCHSSEVARSKKRSATTGHQSRHRATTMRGRLATVHAREQSGAECLTTNETHDHFKRTLAGSEWSVLRGWHVLRHSFISLCAMRGVDQRLIDAWVGHTTEEMRRRYRHLYPSAEQDAIQHVFA